MATRSTIAIEHEDGTVEQVYCHWDGYLSHNGRILQEHYSDRSKLEQSIALGDISILSPEIGEQHDFNAPTEGWTLYYGRDRGEDNVGPKKFANIKEYIFRFERQEYNYLFDKNNVWQFITGGSQWMDLSLSLQELETA